MSMVMIQVRIMVITMVMIMVNIMVITKMMMVMTRGRGNIRAHLRPKNETNGPRAVTVGGGSRVLQCVTECYSLSQSVLQSVTVCHTVCFTVRLYAGHSGRRIWAVDTKVISRQRQHPELSPEMIKLTKSLADIRFLM